MAEPEVEPEQSTDSSPSISPERPQVEPLPEWNLAVKEWGALWPVHIYGIGSLFLLVSLFACWSVAKLLFKTDIRRRKVHVVNWFLLLVFGLSRGLFLIVAAYHSSDVLPVHVVKLLWGIGHPCIITAYVLVFIVLKNALVMKQNFRTWYTTKNIVRITLLYFLFVFVAEMTVSFVPDLIGLTFACQLLYVLFTIFLLVFYSFVAVKIWQKKREGGANGRIGQQSTSRLKSVLLVCFAAIIGGILLCATQIYAMVGVYGVFAKKHTVLPWPWYGFNTIQRLLELYMYLLLCKMLVSKSDTNQRGDLSHNSSAYSENIGRKCDVLVTRQTVSVTNNYPWSTIPGATSNLTIVDS